MWKSPNLNDSDFILPVSIDDKIDVFADRTIGWQLGIANLIANGSPAIKAIPHSGFAVLSIVINHFEFIAKYKEGFDKKGKPEKFFKKGVKEVFPKLLEYPEDIVDDLLKLLYSGARCGLYHDGITGSKIILTGEIKAAVKYDNGKRLIINPHKLVTRLIEHFHTYIEELKIPNNQDLRINFERRFDFEN